LAKKVLVMDIASYNEDEALKFYIWRNYPEIARPHECLPSFEWIRDNLPSELREEYWTHVAECRAIREKTTALEKQSREESAKVLEIMRSFPEMKIGLAALVVALVARYETMILKERVAASGATIVICRCTRCNRILVSAKSRQCLGCGHVWRHPVMPDNEQPQRPSSTRGPEE
jgi:hypothetical protein